MKKKTNRQRPNQKLAQAKRKAMQTKKNNVNYFRGLISKAVEMIKGTKEEVVEAQENHTEDNTEEIPHEVDISSLKKDELINLCIERNVKFAKSWTKAKLIEAIKA